MQCVRPNTQIDRRRDSASDLIMIYVYIQSPHFTHNLPWLRAVTRAAARHFDANCVFTRWLALTQIKDGQHFRFTITLASVATLPCETEIGRYQQMPPRVHSALVMQRYIVQTIYRVDIGHIVSNRYRPAKYRNFDISLSFRDRFNIGETTSMLSICRPLYNSLN